MRGSLALGGHNEESPLHRKLSVGWETRRAPGLGPRSPRVIGASRIAARSISSISAWDARAIRVGSALPTY